jgi:ATP-dependent Lon protease
MADHNAAEPAALPPNLGVLPLRNMVLLPGVTSQLLVGRPSSLELLRQLEGHAGPFAVVGQRRPQVEEPAAADLYGVGVAAQLHRVVQLPDNHLQIVVRGFRRVRVLRLVQQQPHLVAEVESLDEIATGDPEELALARNLARQFQRVVALSPSLSDELQVAAANLDREPGHLADFVAAALEVPAPQKQELLETLGVAQRLHRLTLIVGLELNVLEMGQQIQSKVQEEVGQAQRQQYLQEQLRIIQKELGEESGDELEGLRRRAAAAHLPELARQEVARELERLGQLSGNAAEHTVVRTHLDWLLDLPWRRSSPSRIDVRRAQRVLEEDHDGLGRVKERIVEYVAVRQLKKDSRGPILCFVGPPGVGKTSLGRSIARALGRKFARVSLGGTHDESEIRGHRRTYVGALPGRIIQALRRAGTNNPVFVLDELDKVGSDFRGDPAAALLEVLDPEQNVAFLDHYLDVPFDLSRVTFVATANQLDTIPPALRDRLEIIQLPGYTEAEKVQIARHHLLPRQLAEHGLARRKVAVDDAALHALVRGYTREAGVRSLERELGRLCRKVARQVVGGQSGPFRIDPDRLVSLLGPGRFEDSAREEVAGPGVVPGLAWTPFGGEVMLVEARKMRGGKGLTMTGQLGEVMRESAQIALSYIRSRAADWGLDQDFFENQDLHIHLPSGAVPKDGPSAGVTVATALLSLLTGRPVAGGVAMTGETTLRGRVLPVGGIKEKVLAAHREGYRTVILPRRNERDLEELPDNVRSAVAFVFVDHLDEVFAAALQVQARRAA